MWCRVKEGDGVINVKLYVIVIATNCVQEWYDITISEGVAGEFMDIDFCTGPWRFSSTYMWIFNSL